MKESVLKKFKEWIEKNNITVGCEMVAHMEYDRSYGYSPVWRCYKKCTVEKIDFEKGHLTTELGRYKLPTHFYFSSNLVPVSSKSINHLNEGEFVSCTSYTGMEPDELYPICDNTICWMKECDEQAEKVRKEKLIKATQDELNKYVKAEYDKMVEEYMTKLTKKKFEVFSRTCCANCANFGKHSKNDSSYIRYNVPVEQRYYCGHSFDCGDFMAKVAGEKYIIRNIITGEIAHDYWASSEDPYGREHIYVFELKGYAIDKCNSLNEEDREPYESKKENWVVEVLTPDLEAKIPEMENKLEEDRKAIIERLIREQRHDK